MADKKISALTASTTPLAGTEVLPIVQSGATVKVAVSDLTAGRAIAATGANFSGLTASSAVATDASKNLVSVTNTGTGNNVLATGATLNGNVTVNRAAFQDNIFTVSTGAGTVGNYARVAFAENAGATSLATVTGYGSLYGGSPSYNYAMTFGTQGTERLWLNNVEFRPMADNAYTLGNASYRWSTVYAATALINTSDARTKQQVRDLNEAERHVAQKVKGLLKAFKFNDAVESKGDGARTHFGVMAQDVAAAFASEGLDASRYAMFCHDTWEDQYENVWATRTVIDPETNEEKPEQYIAETRLAISAGDRYGIRYDELLAFVIATL